MAHFGAKIVMKIMTIGVGIPVGIASRKFVEKVWVATGPDRPYKTKHEGVQWMDAISWAALTAVTMAAADLINRKGAEEVYYTLIGEKPPVTARPHASRQVRRAKPRFPETVAPPA
jgi:hypothetical protein